MKKISVLLFMTLLDFYFAQSSVLYNLNNSRLLSNAVNKIGVDGIGENEYEGSPYLEKEFLPSTIKGEKGIFLLRYNIYNDEVILKNGDEFFKLPKEVENFTINNKISVLRINNSYFIQSSSENKNYVIVKKENISFVPAKSSDNNYQQNRMAKFSYGKPDFFLYNLESKKVLPINKDELKAAFPDRYNIIEQNLKKNKLKSVNDFNELLDLLVY